jgi:hypothetical protein
MCGGWRGGVKTVSRICCGQDLSRPPVCGNNPQPRGRLIRSRLLHLYFRRLTRSQGRQGGWMDGTTLVPGVYLSASCTLFRFGRGHARVAGASKSMPSMPWGWSFCLVHLTKGWEWACQRTSVGRPRAFLAGRAVARHAQGVRAAVTCARRLGEIYICNDKICWRRYRRKLDGCPQTYFFPPTVAKFLFLIGRRLGADFV